MPTMGAESGHWQSATESHQILDLVMKWLDSVVPVPTRHNFNR